MKPSNVTSCPICHCAVPFVCEALGMCGECLHDRFPAVQPHLDAVHTASRIEFGLPPLPPRHHCPFTPATGLLWPTGRHGPLPRACGQRSRA